MNQSIGILDHTELNLSLKSKYLFLFFTFPFQVARQFALRTPPTGLDHRQQVKQL
jgi:hypothetical protein